MMTSEPEGDVALPTGTVTFLLTDVSGSTRMWESEPHGPMREAILRHYEILGGAVAAHGGVRPQEQGEGDSVVAVFSRPSDALAAALQAQLMLQAEVWPTTARVQVRMAIHTGEAQLRDAANYAGQAIIRTARLRALGHGGQVLVSGATRDLVVDETAASFGFRPLGEHLLRDLGRREVVWQLTHPDLPSEFEPLSSPGPHRRSLPTPLTPFIGRAAELAELVGLVTTERLVLATGAGGAGKTRLAIEVGAMVGERFVGGVRWVELAALDAGGVESAVRAGFGISEAAEIPLEQSVARLIGEQPCLLIIDNCEHVAAGTASLVDRLLHAAPGLHVLATTRVVLGVPGEVAWRLPPLGLPAVGDTVTVGDLAGFDAIDLFCDRARRARPNFVLTDANAASVREICQRLDGIPLAIELAAARTRMMNPERMLAGLEDSFRLLAGGSQELMPRQQTIEASIAWSYDLLTPAEQRLLRRLAVFVDGWTLEAAEAICVDPIAGGEGAEQDLHEYAVFDALNRLVEHSLVQSEDTPLGIRFGILETVRQFGDRRLKSDSAEWSAAMERHARHHLEWACEVGPDLLSFVYAEHLPALVAERSNLLAACDWSLAHQSGDEVLRALLALRPVMASPEWSSVTQPLLDLTDRLEPQVSTADRWKVHLVRQQCLAGRGALLEEFACVGAMGEAAAAVDDRLGVEISRSLMLTYMTVAGAPVVDEVRASATALAELDDWWAATATTNLLFLVVFHGRLSMLPEAAELVEVHRGPAEPTGHADAIDFLQGIAAFLGGEPRRALGLIRSAHDSRSIARQHRMLVATFIGLAGADLGLDLARGVAAEIRPQYEVEGAAVAGGCAAAMEAVSAILRDDLAAAETSNRTATEMVASLGLQTGWPHERYTLVAAGVSDYAGVLDQPGTPYVEAENERARAELSLQRGALAAALVHAHAALSMERAEHRPRGVLFTLECIARISFAGRRVIEGARLLGACEAFRAERELVRVPCLQRLVDDAVVAAVGAGSTEFDAALAEGASMSMEAAAEYAGRLRVAHGAGSIGWEALTPTERRVADLVAEGLTNAAVATSLLMGPETVKTHLSRVFAKVGVANRKELILAASRRAAERRR